MTREHTTRRARASMNSWDDMAAHDLSPVAGPDEATRRQQTRNPYSPVMILLTLIATIGILAYSAFLLNPANSRSATVRAMPCYHVALFLERTAVLWRAIDNGDSAARNADELSFFIGNPHIPDMSGPPQAYRRGCTCHRPFALGAQVAGVDFQPKGHLAGGIDTERATQGCQRFSQGNRNATVKIPSRS